MREIERQLNAIEASMFQNLEEGPRKEIMDRLSSEYRQLEGLPEVVPQLNRAGVERMKQAMQKSRLIKVR